MRPAVVLSCLVLTLGCGGKQATVDQPASGAPPAVVVDYVDQQWPNAQIAAPSGASCSTPASPPFVTGDFNGDGLTDIAARVAAPDGTRLVHAIARVNTFVFYSIPLEGDLANGQLSMRKRGDKYVPESGVADYFGADTPVVTPCGLPPTAFFPTGTGIDPRKIR